MDITSHCCILRVSHFITSIFTVSLTLHLCVSSSGKCILWGCGWYLYTEIPCCQVRKHWQSVLVAPPGLNALRSWWVVELYRALTLCEPSLQCWPCPLLFWLQLPCPPQQIAPQGVRAFAASGGKKGKKKDNQCRYCTKKLLFFCKGSRKNRVSIQVILRKLEYYIK